MIGSDVLRRNDKSSSCFVMVLGIELKTTCEIKVTVLQITLDGVSV